MLRTRVLAFALALGLVAACDGDKATVQPEPIDSLVLHATYAELLVMMLTAMRTGDLASAQASIATAGQLETMCPDFAVIPTPYTPTNLELASGHCREVFAPITDEALQDSLLYHPYGITHEPEFDDRFQVHWRERCPADFQVYQLWGVFEARGEDTPAAGFEVSSRSPAAAVPASSRRGPVAQDTLRTRCTRRCP